MAAWLIAKGAAATGLTGAVVCKVFLSNLSSQK
jgi:hypothetical protein